MKSSLLENSEIRKHIHHMTIEEYHRLGESGILGGNVELLEGIVIEKMPKSPLHIYILDSILEWFRSNFEKKYWIRSEQPLSINASEPEPDLSIVKGNRDDFIHQHPQTAELIIEIAMSSLSIDKEKAKIYAEANIPFYWIVDANRRGIFQYSEISEGRYLSETFFSFEDNIYFQSAGVAVKEFFPKTVS